MAVENIVRMGRGAVLPYHCPNCWRCFVACGHSVAGEILCMCGAHLVAQPLPCVVYETKSPVAGHRGAAHPHGNASRRANEKERERDLGYGASHGYAPGHEGPTGPGDAPANGEAIELAMEVTMNDPKENPNP